ncbi:flagellar motor protein MotB [Burkholderia ubonensis]|uniref:OmpA family protein n=1 Tax=Burkholderia ubonensis TaxID=101571 RepID=UPI00075D4373|nr:OmpA family protein [Burkholderia ubonensis]KVD59166.1 flagellar motor protein MotB [Burkholderia ubonensis]
MIKKIGSGALLLIALVLVGCTSSGPTFNAYSMNLPNGEKAYRVDCYGLFGSGSCTKKAQEICGDKAVTPVEALAPLASDSTRVLTFRCGAAPQPAPAPASVIVPQQPPMPVVPARSLTLGGDANFNTAQSTLTPSARARLDRLIDEARDTILNSIEVSGYTDSQGSDAYNQRLSEQRAQTVAQYLSDHGVRARQFSAKGYGKANPVASNATAQGRAKNRRVEIRMN